LLLAGVVLVLLATEFQLNPRTAAALVRPVETKLFGRVTIKGSSASLPLETVVVVLKPGTKTTFKAERISGPKGDYAIPNLEPGFYDLLAHDGGSYRKQFIARQKIEKGDNRVDFELEHKPPQKLSGKAATPQGEALAGTIVTFYPPECDDCPILSTTTDERGAYTAMVAPDDYRVAVKSSNTDGLQGVAFVPQTISVLSEQPATLNLKIEWQGSQLSVNLPYAPARIVPSRQGVAVLPNVGNSIMGRIVFGGGAVPSVTVTATHESGRSQTATTDSNGGYRFLNLEPGGYTVEGQASSTLTGFRQTNIQVGASQGRVVDVQLAPSGTGEVAQVTVDPNVSSDQFLNFPTQRTVQSLYSIAPNVARSGLRDASGRDRDPSVAGSSSPENSYILDGVNIADPAFGGSSANLPFEFVQEVEVKAGAFGAEYGKATGGIMNVITRSGGNRVAGDAFGYFTTRGLVRETRNFPFTGSAPNGFSEVNAGFDIGGPIKKDKLWFFGAFNPQHRKNSFLTQTLHAPVEDKITTPFYAGKLTWAINQRHTFTFSTLGDFTRIEGFLASSALNNVNGFGDDLRAFLGRQEIGGHNYRVRLNSTITSNFTAEVSAGLQFQRANTIPTATDRPLITDNFAVLKGNTVLVPTETGINFVAPAGEPDTTGFIDFVDGRGGSLQRNFARGPGFGLFSFQDRNRYDIQARLMNIVGPHTIKWGFEWSRNSYDINTRSSGPAIPYAFAPGAVNPDGTPLRNTNGAANVTNGSRITNNWLVCTVRGTAITCPTSAAVQRAQAIPAATLAALGLTVNPSATAIGTAEAFGTPFLLRNTTRVRDYQLIGNTYTNTEAFYVQDDWRLNSNWQVSFGARWDFGQASDKDGASYIKLNNWWDNMALRLGVTWDFTGKGRGKLFANYGTYIESTIPLELSVRASGGKLQSDKNFNVNTLNAPAGSLIVPGVSTGAINLGSAATPIDPGLKPQSLGEFTGGIEYEVVNGFILGARGIYRHMRNVIEDGSFDDGETYFIFNPGRNAPGTFEAAACAGPPAPGCPSGCFGKAQRFYRALELTATKRFSNRYQFIASYVFSSLIGNYEGVFRNDIALSDPKMTSLFDLQSLPDNNYGRLPNDRPHQFKFSGSYRTPWKITISGNFDMQSGSPFNLLVPHPVYGDNEGLGAPRGTAIVPAVMASDPGFPNFVDSIGSTRAPWTTTLDVGVNYPIDVGEEKELRLVCDWFNVLNSQRAIALDQTFSINSGVAGIPAVANPFWGAALLVQAPSTLRFGVKFRF
jgi:outer membrane receptor protein involved in Fe transport